MRPVQLSLDGFVSYRDPVTIDFTDADYFALIGPTGAGKSTVIDAFTFALYGSVHRWDDQKIVNYALAPSASRAAVRLVFDMGPRRYVVAREVRRTTTTFPHKARLERLVDPAGLGGVDEATVPLASDSQVRGAVEGLLGLTFEQFCTCVVLPQGDFAEFLHATRGDRQKILLKLLGAERYDAIARAANSVAAAARQRAEVLAAERAGYADATAEAEKAAAAEVHRLGTLSRAVTATLLPALTGAQVAREQARAAADRSRADRARLAAVAVPDDVAALHDSHTAAAQAQAAGRADERAAELADTAAREAVAALPPREPLEQAGRDHVELAAQRHYLPEAAADAGQAALAAQRAAAAVTIAESAAADARTIRDTARAEATAAAGIADTRAAEVELLHAVTAPPGLADLDRRTRTGRDVLADAEQALTAAEAADNAARSAVAAGPPPAAVGRLLDLLTDAVALNATVESAAAAQTAAAAVLRRADRNVAAVDQAVTAARAAQEAARRDHEAFALRAQLVPGQPCPVCEHPVGAVPPAGHAAELDAADAAVQNAVAGQLRAVAVQTAARAGTARADAAHAGAIERRTAVLTQLTTLVRTPPLAPVAKLPEVAALVAAGTADPGTAAADAAARAAVETVAADIDRVDTAARAAAAAVVAARATRDDARTQAAVDSRELADTRTQLRAARDLLVGLGVPAVYDTDVVAAWATLLDWVRATLRTARKAAARAATRASAADAALEAPTAAVVAAGAAVVDARGRDRAAAADVERAAGELRRIEAAIADLAVRLVGAPSDDEVLLGMAMRLSAEQHATVADLDLRAARTARAAADTAVAALAEQSTAAWQMLRRARDSVHDLGGPDVAAGASATAALAPAWAALLAWAAAEIAARTAAEPALLAEVAAATVAVTRAAADLTTAAAAAGVDLPGPAAGRDVAGGTAGAGIDPGSWAATLVADAGTAVALAREQARGRRARIVERREHAERLFADQRAAEEEGQVAKLLGDLLSANNFQRWLAAAALDTLLTDASKTLLTLSGDQFELTHVNGDFLVIDHADGDTQRPIKTLSGGETFQASLALALALSAQLAHLAAGSAIRLDSLFLDEGFGSLDEATLETVAGTLETLANTDRMVGVITHVGALADRVPVRFLVSRDERTSTVVREAL
jgi:exonuclease SbcC